MTRLDAPREDLVRMSSTLRSAADGNTLFGYAAIFNDPTTIDSWEGNFIEQIAPGAFRKTLKERGDQVKVLFNHGMDPSIGDKPLGKPTVQEEDATGLRVECPLDDTSYNSDIKALLRSGALNGMSIRMSVVNDKWVFPADGDNSLPVRTITEIRLLEWGPVTFPAYQATQAGVRAHAPAAYEAWRSAHPTKATIMPPKPTAVRATDETPEDLIASLDVTIDAVGDALDAGNIELASGLLTAADAVVDDLMDLMGIADPDEDDGRSQHPTGEDRSTPDVDDDPVEQIAIPPADPEVTGDHDEPPVRHSSPTRSLRLTRERRALTLGSIEEYLANEQERTDEYQRRFQRQTQGA